MQLTYNLLCTKYKFTFIFFVAYLPILNLLFIIFTFTYLIHRMDQTLATGINQVLELELPLYMVRL